MAAGFELFKSESGIENYLGVLDGSLHLPLYGRVTTFGLALQWVPSSKEVLLVVGYGSDEAIKPCHH
jgi:hypothetical protein